MSFVAESDLPQEVEVVIAAPRKPAAVEPAVIAGRPRPAVGGWTPYRGTAGSQFWSAGELWSCCGAVFGFAA